MDGSCYKSYLSLCSKYSLRAPWETLETPWAFRTPAAGLNVLERLLERHDEGSLLTCGLAVQDAEGRLQISSLLAQPDAPLIALTGPDGVSDLLTADGCIRGERCPLFGVLDDEHAREAIRRDLMMVLLTADMEDAIVLRAVGCIAAPVVGLGEFGQRGVELLAKYYDLHGRPIAPADSRLEAPRLDEPLAVSSARLKEAAAAAGLSLEEFMRPGGASQQSAASDGAEQADLDYVELVVAKWSPSSLSLAEPEAVVRAVERFRELAEFRSIDLQGVGQWRPTADDLSRLRFAAERREAAWMKDAILESLERSVQTLSEAQLVVAPASPTGPLELLRQAPFGDETALDGRRRRQEALDECHRLASDRLVEQLLAQADAEPDPLRRAVLLQFAQLNEQLRNKTAVLRQRFNLLESSRRVVRERIGDPTLNEMLAIGSQMLALAKEMKQWGRPRTSCPTMSAQSKIHFPPLIS